MTTNEEPTDTGSSAPIEWQLKADIANALSSYADFLDLWQNCSIAELRATLTRTGGTFKFSIEHDKQGENDRHA